jgi:hypothetical protein
MYWLSWFAYVVVPALTLLLVLAMGVIIVRARSDQRRRTQG